MAPIPQQRSTSEAVERLRRKLHNYMEQAAGAVEDVPMQTRSIFSYARYLVGVRRKLRDVAWTIHEADVELHERLLRQAAISYLSRPERFANLRGRVELLQAWTTVLIEASEKLEADRERAAAYAEAAPYNNASDDLSAVSAASRAMMGRWHAE